MAAAGGRERVPPGYPAFLLSRPRSCDDMATVAQVCPGPVTRRAALKFGAIGLGGLTLGDIFRLQAQAASGGRTTIGR